MSPKDFRKISHPEPELSTNKVSGDERTNGGQTDEQTQPLLELTLQGGQLKICLALPCINLPCIDLQWDHAQTKFLANIEF